MPAADSTYQEIGAFDAKTRLSELLRKVEQGERFTITVRGRAVADMVPTQDAVRLRAADAVQRIMEMPKVYGVSAEEIRAWIDEGRE